MISLKKIRAILLLICALAVPVPSPAEDYSDMFSVMFRMMLIMMNGMSDAMLDNSNVAGWDTGNSFDFGMTTLPMMSGMSGINPVSGFGGVPGMSPWSGMNPATGFGGMPGMSPWSVPFNNNSWTYPYTNTYPYNANPYNANNPYANRGYAGYPPAQTSLLGGKWYGNAGEILQIRGNRFRLQDGQTGINGTIRIENNIVSLYCPQTGTVSQYTFIRNQSELLLQDPSGQVLMFTQQPIRGSAHTF